MIFRFLNSRYTIFFMLLPPVLLRLKAKPYKFLSDFGPGHRNQDRSLLQIHDQSQSLHTLH